MSDGMMKGLLVGFVIGIVMGALVAADAVREGKGEKAQFMDECQRYQLEYQCIAKWRGSR